MATKRARTKTAGPVAHGRGSLLRVLHPFPSLLVAALTVALAAFADPDAPRGLVVRLGVGMLLFQFAIGVTNDIVDLEDDRRAKSWKPIARGAISRQRAVLLAAGFAGAGLLVTAALPLAAWLMGAAGLFCGLSYDTYFKRTPLSWLPYAVAIPLIPAWVYTALERWDGFLWWVFPLGALLGLSVHLANQAPDITADRERGVDGIAHRLGGRRSRGIAIALFGIVASIAVLVLLSRSPGRSVLAAVDGATVAMLAPRVPMFFGRDGLFGLFAAGSAVLAVVFLSAV